MQVVSIHPHSIFPWWYGFQTKVDGVSSMLSTEISILMNKYEKMYNKYEQKGIFNMALVQ